MVHKLNIFIDKGTRKTSTNLAYISGKVGRYFAEDENIEAFSEDEQLFIAVVQDAHAMMTDLNYNSNMSTVVVQLAKLHGIDKQQCRMAVQVADALFNSQTSAQKHYIKAMLIKKIELKMEECDKSKDHKSWLKFYAEYIKLQELDKAITDDPLDFYENKTINFMPNPELLESYNVEEANIIDSTIKRIEQKAREKSYGSEI